MRRWYLHRLRAMSWREIRLRTTRRLRDSRDRRRFASGGAEAVAGAPPSPDEFLSRWTETPWILNIRRLEDLASRWPETWKQRTVAEAEEIHAGRFRWLGAIHDLGVRPRWREETVSGVEFPAAHWIDLAPSSPTGAYDLKHLWVPNVHGAFVTLAKAHLLTGDDRHRDHLLRLWGDWLEQNPPLCGPNYLAPIEIGRRLISWGAALRFLAARRSPDPEFLTAVFRNAHYQRFTIADNLSRHSSANNHLLGELAGLVMADAAFPGLATVGNTERWHEELRAEVLKQFHPDGGNREQALHYHAFVLAYALLAVALRREQGRPWPDEVEDRLRAAVAFLDAGLDRRDAPFLYGDCDESEVLPLAEGERHLYLPLLAQARALFEDGGEPQVGRIPEEGDERTTWLAGETAFPRAATAASGTGEARAPRERPSALVFPHSGHVWLRSGSLEVHLNAGELGYLSIAAHAHADPLSVAVRYDGHPVIIDPGTFTYRGGDPWRERLVSAAAHGTVTVDGQEPAERLGPFLWGRKYHARLIEDAEPSGTTPGPAATAEHDGYRSLGVTHRRRVEITGPTSLVIDDALTGAGPHDIRVGWPLGPGRVEPAEGGAVVYGPGWSARITLQQLPGPVKVETGETDNHTSPCSSPGYDRLETGHGLIWSGLLTLPARWRTTIEFSVAATSPSGST